MQRFMFIVREDLKKIGKLTDSERLSNVPIPHEWLRSLAESGNYVTGEALAVTGRYVSKNEVLSDGPFIEAKEGISGFDIILAENLEQAVSIAQTHPLITSGAAIIEIRPFLFQDQEEFFKNS
jgi:hypothetical protein